MKKMIVEGRFAPVMGRLLGNLFDKVECVELIELIRLDIEKGVKLVLVDLIFKPKYTIEDLDSPPGMEVVDVLKRQGRRYTCLIKGKAPADMVPLFRKFQLDLVWDTPSRVTGDGFTLCCQGDEEDLRRLLEVLKIFTRVEEIKILAPTYHKEDILSCLTERQRDVLLKANQKGYYQHPRLTNTEELSKDLGLSKSTVTEHLRKAESRLMKSILAGHLT